MKVVQAVLVILPSNRLSLHPSELKQNHLQKPQIKKEEPSKLPNETLNKEKRYKPLIFIANSSKSLTKTKQTKPSTSRIDITRIQDEKSKAKDYVLVFWPNETKYSVLPSTNVDTKEEIMIDVNYMIEFKNKTKYLGVVKLIGKLFLFN